MECEYNAKALNLSMSLSWKHEVVAKAWIKHKVVAKAYIVINVAFGYEKK